MSEHILGYLKVNVGQVRSELETQVYLRRKDEEFLNSAEGIDHTFCIRMKAEVVGEKDTELDSGGLIRDAIFAACEYFKQQNNRSNVQAQCTVHVLFPSGFEMLLPARFWHKWFDEYRKPLKEVA